MKTTLTLPLYSLLLLLILSSCRQVEPRRPITNNSSSTTKISVENNRKLYAAEEKAIEAVIAKEGNDYKRSSFGFYYAYVTKIDSASAKPRFGDEVTFEYDVVSLKGDTIYYMDELSPITKSMEQEYGIFRGMRETLKMMKVGEELMVYYPSYMGYGYYGDEDRIGTNIPFKSSVKLLGINLSSKARDTTLSRKRGNDLPRRNEP
jgi:gliding motility-associated peptidyl-prolyl isomerase